MRKSVVFYLNGERNEVSGKDVFLPLSSYLRYRRYLTGTKVVCAEGDCGACTVMAAKGSPSGLGATPQAYQSVNACIALTFAFDGANLVTVEGLTVPSPTAHKLNEVQCSMLRNFGGQCGFCTPGFVMSITNMYEQKSMPGLQNAKNYLTGNLCRCTGYAPILQAALDVDPNKHVPVKELHPQQDLSEMLRQPVLITNEKLEFFAPTTLQDACAYKAKYPDAVVFSGATDLGVQVNKGHLQLRRILSLHLIPELYVQSIHNDEVILGARVSLAEFQKLISGRIDSLDRFLNIFASPQIKNMGTLVGNLANASPIADMAPVLMALDAELDLVGSSGGRTINLQDFYMGYKKLDLKTDELITQVRFKVPQSGQKIQNYKISQRRDLDISTVNASFNFTMKNNQITKARIALGGVAATTLRLTEIEKQIEGTELSSEKVSEIKALISGAIKPLSDVRGSAEYRRLLIVNLFEKFTSENFDL